MNILKVSLLSFYASTNLGAIIDVQNGFGQLAECQFTPEHGCVSEDLLQQFSHVLDQTTTNRCLASQAHLNASGVKIPKCPTKFEQLQGLDNSYPTGAIFVNYAGDNDMFVMQLVEAHLKNDPNAIINIVVYEKNLKWLLKNEKLTRLINQKNINIIPITFFPKVERWMQDSMQFMTVKGKPALYQLEHANESKTNYTDRLTCEIARQCNLPYFVPEQMVDPLNADFSALNSGGNLEVLPGGTFYRGIVKTRGFNNNIQYNKCIAKDESLKDRFQNCVPFESEYQKVQKAALEKNGNRVVDIDISFLNVGHVDEIINIVKTAAAPPCNFAVLMASPNKAIELLAKNRFKARLNCNTFELQAINSVAVHRKIDPLADEAIKRMYDGSCIDKFSVNEFLMHPEYALIRRENILKAKPKAGCDEDKENCSAKNIATILNENSEIIKNEIRAKTKCEEPVMLEIPVLFKDGSSYLPNQVNGVVQTNHSGASNFIAPRSYFKPFDDYVEAELKKVGVKVSLIHDLEYHLLQGEVHCGTNSIPVCDP